MEVEEQKSLLRGPWKGRVPQQPGAGELHPSEKKENANLWGAWPQYRKPRPCGQTLETSG